MNASYEPSDKEVMPPAGACSRGKILVVDDDPASRLFLGKHLINEGYCVITAVDGAQAVRKFSDECPDMIFMDVMLPVMNGYEATQEIKALASDRFVPVIFLTSLTDDDALAKCIEAGGDDFLLKPYKRAILRSKIVAMERIRGLYQRVKDQHEAIGGLYDRLRRDQEIAEQIFNRAVTADNVALNHINTLLRSTDTFNGDLLLTAHRPSGGLNVLFGDFTGHGVVAAIGALPASQVFNSMTIKGFSAEEILSEINHKLHKLLPTGMFLSACFISVSEDLRMISVWNGGMPEFLVLGASDDGVKHRVTSMHLPLGIIEDSKEFYFERLEIMQGDHIVMCSDGLLEARNLSGEQFGEERFIRAVLADRDPDAAFSNVVKALDRFCEINSQADDVSLVDIPCIPGIGGKKISLVDVSAATNRATSSRGMWKWLFELQGQSLANVDPLPLAINQLREIGIMQPQMNELYTVISELYSNALDHGILRLDSGIKAGEDGFVRYYTEREGKLKDIADGFVRMELEHTPAEGGGRIMIRVEDSGGGFNFESKLRELELNDGYSGRGIMLVRNLCGSLFYKGSGNCVEAVYSW